MKTDRYADRQTERTMDSLNNIQRAEAPAFFYTRLQARLEKSQPPRTEWWMALTRPAVSFTVLALLLVVNIVVLTNYIRTSKNETGATQSTSGIQQFAETYGLNGTSVFTDKTNGQ